jgi:hypothetical protein
MQVAKVILSVGSAFAEEVDLMPGDWGLLLCEDDQGGRLTIAGHPDLAEMSGGSDLTVRQEVESYLASRPDNPLERLGWPEDWDSGHVESAWLDLDVSRLELITSKPV